MIDLRRLGWVSTLIVGPLLAQAEPSAPPSQPPAAEVPAPAAAKSTQALIQALGSDSYRDRLEAERQLRERGEAALPALREAAKSSADAEVQWRARRLLRQLQGAGAGGLQRRERQAERESDAEAPSKSPGRGAEPPLDDPLRQQFESLFERFERDFGLDVPRARFFGEGFFRDLRQQLPAAGTSKGMSVQIGPDGAVRVEVVERGEDGKDANRVYEAPDLETFQRQYPGVLQRNGLGLGLQFGTPGGSWGGVLAPLQLDDMFPLDGVRRRVLRPWQPAAPEAEFEVPPGAVAAPAPGRRLGISILPEVPPAVRDYLELPAGVGLSVESVQPDSLAAALGLQRGDIVTKVAGCSIGSPRDVQEALGPLAKGAEVEVEFVRKGTVKTARAAKTEATADDVEVGDGVPRGLLPRGAAPVDEPSLPPGKGGASGIR